MLKNILGFARKSQSKSQTKKILVVEDDSLLSKVLAETLKKEGFEVMVVDNGNDAVTMIRKFLPQLILLDLVIPGIDGFAVLKELKADDKLRSIPVVILSNLDEIGDVKSVKALGADDYFIKANTEMKKIVDYAKRALKA
ncbi:MAG: response regulator [Patescibacteria group bacterium]|jgi:DNA-binding response OmpR family regulator